MVKVATGLAVAMIAVSIVIIGAGLVTTAVFGQSNTRSGGTGQQGVATRNISSAAGPTATQARQNANPLLAGCVPCATAGDADAFYGYDISTSCAVTGRSLCSA